MREVFSSPRLENVEKVARWLEEQDIPVRITNGRSYHGNRRRHFSYRGTGNGPQAAVWVIHSEDQPRARALMREAGLSGPTTRPVVQSPVGTTEALPQVPADPVLPPSVLQRINRFRRVLLIVIAVIAAMAIWAV
ncbi:hypothetical protein E4582_05720 [Luteimonas yindakuii]|uniref:DUF2007 domain-containing protein n=1 Tax=Luteimonas yindakuii TaxID=2565782 RepID=A0A4Z1RL15_9GAMM|nr:hypothetical protein [Luteimonas yindakuii]TKS54311.1 hypothetical protein E4582_05720 [Luteimonas yindakuii]